MKKVNLKSALLILMFAVSACGKKDASAPVTSKLPGRDELIRSVYELKHKRIKELFVVLFEKNFAPHEWKFIFDQTNILSANKKKIRLIEGLDDDASSEIRGKLITENAGLLTALSEKSLFMMNWSIQDENCKLALKDFWQLVCKPRNLNNPLNGGLPHGVGAVEWVSPDPITSVTKTPYLRIRLQRDLEEPMPLAYQLELRLKEERITEAESWFKGEALPSTESVFVRQDSTPVTGVFPFGYVEMTLGN